VPGCLGEGGRGFPAVGSHPALIDFERSVIRESDLLQSSGASVVERGKVRGPLGGLRNLTAAPNDAAERCAADLLARLGRSPRQRVLVIGGGTLAKGADRLVRDGGAQVIAFDLYASPWTQFIADAHQIPLADASVDAVWVQAVLEHVLDPWHAVTEIERVLSPRGWVYAETPFLQQVHEGPYDFTRFTESGHRWLFRRFERIDSGVVAGPGNQLTWTLDFVTRGLFRSFVAGRAARVASFWANALDRLIPERFAVDAASCVLFDGSKSERALTPAEIVAHYRGAQR
jgi:SAM-dependent methyltransferase